MTKWFDPDLFAFLCVLCLRQLFQIPSREIHFAKTPAQATWPGQESSSPKGSLTVNPITDVNMI
jgi:hypothetical protein